MAEKITEKKTGKKVAVVAPSKKTMNFIHHESSFNPKRVLPLVLVIIVISMAFVKFGIMDPLDKKTAALKELSLKQEQLAAVNAKLAGYDDLAMEYGRYSYGWMNDAEVNMVNRMDVLQLIEKKVAPKASIEDFAVNNNILTMKIHGITLDEASKMVKSLEESDMVEIATVYNAVAESADEAEIFMSIILTKEAE